MNNVLYFYYDSPTQATVLVLENGSKRLDKITPLRYLKESCLLYGSSYKGVREAFSYCINVKRKIPICVSVYFRLLFIPTMSERSLDTIYIQFSKVKKIGRNKKGCYLVFNNQHILDLDCSVRTMKKQYERCSEFLEISTTPRLIDIV